MVARILLVAGALLVGPSAVSELAAQGSTTAAVSGRVTDDAGAPLNGVAVRVVNQSTGLSRTTTTNQNGQYLIPGLPIGGPYRIEVSGLGYGAEPLTGVTLTLGQNYPANFTMATRALELEGINVTSERTRQELINPSRTGAEQLITEHQLQTLPTISRNFTDFVALSPLAGGGAGSTSVAGQNNRFNNVQIDGAISQDLFGLGSTGQPGGQAGARSISIEAVKEYQILTAPYDVRQSGFTGGLINAVTKSGTNQISGSFYGFMRDENFVRENLLISGANVPFREFTNRLLGGTVGGPIVRNRIHFFVSGEFEQDERPASGLAVGRDAPTQTGIAQADADRFVQALQGRGVNPGGYGAADVQNPNRNLFARIDAQINDAHRLTLRHNYVRATDDVVVNRSGGSNYSLSSNFYFFESTTHAPVLQLSSLFGGSVFNELTLGWTNIRDRRTPAERYPAVQVSVPNQAGSGSRRLVSGAEYFSQGNELDQDSWQVTNNLSFNAGDHRITVGASSETFKFRNLFWPGLTGEWSFSSLADLEAGRPSSYRRAVAAGPNVDPTARFAVTQLALYGQTEWSGIQNVTLTAGLRYDMPFILDDPMANPAIEQAFGRRTNQLPSGSGILSPRLGFNWDVSGDQVTQIRGGAGIFTGRYPFVWLSNLYSNTGLSTVTLSCSGTNVPAFTLDVNAQPTACATTGAPTPPRAVINLMDPDFQWPHAWRFNAAVDRQLPLGIVGTAEFLYTKSRKQIFLRELNVDFANPVSTTQGGRPVFGTHRAGALASGANNNSLATPKRINASAADAVVEVTNSDQDRSWSMTLQGQRRWAGVFDVTTSYTYADAQDITGLTSSIATSNIGFNPVAGSPNTPTLSTSNYETKHKVVFSGSYEPVRWLTVSTFYIGNSGDPYTYVYDGDVNADGFEAPYASNRFNDLLYVPTGPSDITLVNAASWDKLNSYIEGESCLRENRGKILERNVCEGPWQNRVDTRFTFKVPTRRQQRAEISLDIFNFLNLLNEEWGQRRGADFPGLDLLELRGWDVTNKRGIFDLTNRVRLDEAGQPDQFTVFDPSSRWQMQLGVRYAF